MVILTRVDEACPLVKKDLKNIYLSKYIKEKVSTKTIRLYYERLFNLLTINGWLASVPNTYSMVVTYTGTAHSFEFQHYSFIADGAAQY